MSDLGNLAYITGNIAPFRVELLDELSHYFDRISLFYYNEIDAGVNPDYVNKRPKNVDLICLKHKSLSDSFKLLKSYQYTIFDGYSGKNKILLMLLYQIKKKAYMISIDGIIETQAKIGIKKLLKAKLIGKARTVFSTNKSTDDIILDILRNIDITRHYFTTIREGDYSVIEDIDKYEVFSKYGFDVSKKLILFVGKFLSTKGIREIIECAKRHPYNYCLVGGTVDQLSALGLNVPDNTKVIKFLEKKDVLSLMKCCDVFALPTYTDVWGLVIVEALSCGAPVVTTNRCNAGLELIKEGYNGYLVPIGKVDELDDSIKKALSLNRDDVEKYNKKLMREYTIENSAKRMQKIIHIKG